MSDEQQFTQAFSEMVAGGSASKEENAGEQAAEPTPDPLTDEQAELQRRYSLTDEDARRVRGETWAELNEDAERLSRLSEPTSIRERTKRNLQELWKGNPNATELSLLLADGDKRNRDAELVRLFHPEPREEDNR